MREVSRIECTTLESTACEPLSTTVSVSRFENTSLLKRSYDSRKEKPGDTIVRCLSDGERKRVVVVEKRRNDKFVHLALKLIWPAGALVSQSFRLFFARLTRDME